MTDFQCDFSTPSVIKAIKVNFDVRGGAFNPDCPFLVLAQMCESDNDVLGTLAGTATPLQPVQVFGNEDALFGERCEASLAVKRARAINRNAKIWVQPLPNVGVNDAWRVQFGADLPVANATIKQLLVAGEVYTVTVNPDDSAADIASKFESEINADAGAGYSAETRSGVLTITATNPGIASAFKVRNEYCRFNIAPTIGCEIENIRPAAGSPDIEEALASLGNDCFCDVVMPYADPAALIAFREWLCEQWASCSDCYSRGYGFAGNAVYADQISAALAVNSPHMMMIGATNFDEQPATLMSAVAAEIQPQLVNDPYLPVDCVSIRGLTPPDKSEVPPETIIDAAGIDGLTHLQTLADGSVQINVGVSSYTYDTGGQKDLRYQNFNLLSVYRETALYLRQRWNQTFTGAAFARDDFVPLPGQKIVNRTLLEASVVGWLSDLANEGNINLPEDDDVQVSVDAACCFNVSVAIRPLSPVRCVNFGVDAILKEEAA